MVPVSLFLWICGEIATYLAIAHYWFGAAWPAAALAAAGALLGVRAGIVIVTWAYAAAYDGGEAPLPPGQRLRMWLAEYLAFLALFLLVMPFERLTMGPDRLRASKRPILLVHGYGCSRGVWRWLLRRLEAAGHVVATVSLAPPYTSIGKLVPQLAQRVDEVCAATGAKQVTLVAHSMGGLVCRSYLARFGSEQVAKLVTLASPHSGTELARIGIGQNAREMEPDSLWLRDLAAEPIPVPTVVVRNIHDNYVMPDGNQRLTGAQEVPLDGIGHLAMLFSGRTAAIVLDAVGRPA